MCSCDPAVSGSRLLVADRLYPVGYKLGPPGTIIFQACPMDTQSDMDLGNFEAASALKALCHIPPAVPISMLFTSTISGVNDVADRVCAHDS